MGRTVEVMVVGVVDKILLWLTSQSALYMHHKVKFWKFGIALKKMSPFRLFSTLDVSRVTRMNISLPAT